MKYHLQHITIPNTRSQTQSTYQVDGWDGHEDESKQKWTFLGSSNHLNKFVFYHRFSMNLKALNLSFFARFSLLLDRPYFHDRIRRPDSKDSMGKGFGEHFYSIMIRNYDNNQFPAGDNNLLHNWDSSLLPFPPAPW